MTYGAGGAVSITCAGAGGTFLLNVSRSGTGVITSTPLGIYCGADCTESYAGGTIVTLTATPDPGSTFGSWTGCGSVSGTVCTVVLSAPLAVTAVFNGAGGTDGDSDGYATPADCNDADPAVNPGAADLPDLAFVDSDCDGIDGDESLAVFVGPGGNDSNAGTRGAPKLTLSSAVSAAAALARNVYAQAGVYATGGGLVLASNVGIYGGYSSTWTSRSFAPATEIQGSPQAVLASFASNAGLQLVTLRSTPMATGSGYGLRALSSTVSVEGVSIVVGAGANGSGGASGSNGAGGGVGGAGGAGSCDGGGVRTGGSAGASVAGRPGGAGGFGGSEGRNYGSPGSDGAGPGGGNGGSGGSGDDSGNPGGNGQPGAPGANGASGAGGAGGSVASGVWSSAAGAGGLGGAHGNGGGGGGGGGGQGGTWVNDGAGNGGGGGGGAGAGGTGGSGGTGGGGSFGVLLVDSTLTVIGTGSSITTANGGAGGAGAPGGAGGAGGFGGAGATVCTVEVGAGGNGGAGGSGGSGGHGGGGAGGPSVGIYRAGTSNLVMTSGAIAFTIGAGGAPGSPNGVTGMSVQIQ